MYWVFLSPAQIPHAKTETVHVAGNCAMCKSTIETSASVKNEAAASWDADNQRAEITYDSTVTALDEVLRRIAYAGYDNEQYLAPAEAYASLEKCCQYDRLSSSSNEIPSVADGQTSTAEHQSSDTEPVYETYFALKDALVAGDAASASASATFLATQLSAQPSNERKNVATHATELAGKKSIGDQRTVFVSLSDAMYRLAKAETPDTVIYYQHCPMFNKGKGAHWLSREKEIKNPYYGEMMLTCGSVVETLRK